MSYPRLMDELPNDLAISIFLKLPVKSLVRFRCLSKSYSAVFRSPDFIASHRKRNQDPQILLKLCRSFLPVEKSHITTLSADFLSIENIQMPFLDDCIFDADVDGPCNGLLLLSDHDRLALWNPSTREFKLLPPSTMHCPLEFEKTSFDRVGFGFDSRSGEYKVVRFFTNYFDDGTSCIIQVEIYCLNSNSWRQISAPKELLHGYSTFGDLENGFYHWSEAGTDDIFINSFDFTNESFTSTTLPEFDDDYFWNFIKPLDGVMRFIAYPCDGEEKVFDIWLKKDRWTKGSSIGPLSGVKQLLGSWNNGQMFLESNKGELLLLLDVESGEIKNFGLPPFPGFMQVIMYSESLVPVNGRTEQQEGIVRERFLDGQLMKMKIT